MRRRKKTAVHGEIAQQSAAELRRFSAAARARSKAATPREAGQGFRTTLSGTGSAHRQTLRSPVERIGGLERSGQQNADLCLRTATNILIARQIAAELRINIEGTVELVEQRR